MIYGDAKIAEAPHVCVVETKNVVDIPSAFKYDLVSSSRFSLSTDLRLRMQAFWALKKKVLEQENNTA